MRELIGAEYVAEERASYTVGATAKAAAQMGIDQVVTAIGDLEKQMKAAAKALDFERAAQLRDEVAELRKFVNPADVARRSRWPLFSPRADAAFALFGYHEVCHRPKEAHFDAGCRTTEIATRGIGYQGPG